jgi:hypothetical protein
LLSQIVSPGTAKLIKTQIALCFQTQLSSMSKLPSIVAAGRLPSLDLSFQVAEIATLQTLFMPSVVILVQDKVASAFRAAL